MHNAVFALLLFAVVLWVIFFVIGLAKFVAGLLDLFLYNKKTN